MKLLFVPALAAVALALASCETTSNSRKAGGAAFSDSELGRELDSNLPGRDRDSPRAGSFQQWLETDLQ